MAYEILRDFATSSPSDAVRSGLEVAALGMPQQLSAIVSSASRIGVELPAKPHQPGVRWAQLLAHAVASPVAAEAPVTSLDQARGHTSVEVVAFEERERPLPLGDSTHFIFKHSGRMYVPPVNVHVLEKGTISFRMSGGGRTEFYVFDCSGNCIDDLSWGVVPFVASDVSEVRGDLGVLSDQFSGPMNICHFLADHLTRVHIYDRISNRAKLLLADDHPYYREVLSLAGLAERTIIPAAHAFTLRADRLLVSSNLHRDFRHPAHWGSAWATEFLRKRLVTDRPSEGRRVFVSRKDASSRRILNGDSVEQEFLSRGFEVLSLTGLPAAEQIRIFAAAGWVAGLHGAGLANILFAPSAAKVLEIIPPFVATEAYWLLASQMGQQYWALVASDPELPNPDYATWRHAPEFAGRDVVVPMDQLRATLDSFLV
jgi:hypothetical protein